MWTNKKYLVFILAQLLIFLSNEVSTIHIPFMESINGIGSKIVSVTNLTDKVPSPTNIFNEVTDHVSDSIDVVKNWTDLAATTSVFINNNVILNCFGLPIKLFAKAVEQMFSQTTKAQHVRFYFTSRKQPEYATVRIGKNFSLEGTDYDITRPTVLLIHGFLSSGRESWLQKMKNALLKLADVNVIVVDWQEGSNTWNYYSAAISTRIVGLQIARLFALIRDLESKNAPNISQWGELYFIGHSLGSHISAHAAFLIRESQNAKDEESKWIVSRITGLDPAQPCFATANLTLKLDKDDAPFVDIIHTNANHIYFLGLGLPDQLGFVDFYPNGGEIQPGCSDLDTSIWNFLLLPRSIIQEVICSHGRSHAFFTESVVSAATGNCSFVGYKWDRTSKHVGKILNQRCVDGFCTEMGVNSRYYYPNNSGTYFVPTQEKQPFCVLDKDVKEVFEQNTSKNTILKKLAKKIF